MMKHVFVAACLLLSCACFAHDIEATKEFKIGGLVQKEMTVTVAALQKFPQVALGEVTIRNHRGEEKGTAKDMKGILLKTLLDSAGIGAGKPKEYSSLYIVLTASDGYTNVYSWNEIFNTEVGNSVYILTSKDGKDAGDIEEGIIAISTKDMNSGRRYLKALKSITVKKAE